MTDGRPSDADVALRTAGLADVPDVVALLGAQLDEHAIALSRPALAAAVDASLRRPAWNRILLASFRGTSVGVAVLAFNRTLEHGGRAAWLDELYVAPAHREGGIGRRLLRAALVCAADAGARAVDLEVDEAHRRAERLYAREGFRPIARARWSRSLHQVSRADPRPTSFTGGCFCGAIRYAVDGPALAVTHCHCGICRRTTGAPFVTWLTVSSAAFRLTAGAPAERRSTARGCRAFCAACGTALTFRGDGRPDALDVTVGSLDHPERVTPDHHEWTTSQLPWIHVDDDLPGDVEDRPPHTDDG